MSTGISDTISTLQERVAYLEAELCERDRKHTELIGKLKGGMTYKEIQRAIQESLPVHTNGRGPAAQTSHWVQVGREHEELSVPPDSLLRYGLRDCWVEKRYGGKFKATNEFFGKDPLYGTGKVVEMLVG